MKLVCYASDFAKIYELIIIELINLNTKDRI